MSFISVPRNTMYSYTTDEGAISFAGLLPSVPKDTTFDKAMV